MTGNHPSNPVVRLLEATMKTDVPVEAEARMRTHLEELRRRMRHSSPSAPAPRPAIRPPARSTPASRAAAFRTTRAAGAAVALATAATVVWMTTLLFGPGAAVRVAAAEEFVLVPEGGRLDALDEMGQLVGPCPLQRTDVDVRISGHFTRVKVAQRYRNPYKHKIEAVYTFPLGHRAAVDRMTMTVGDRVVQGEVKERFQARRIYEAARNQGHVAALLEQERPNIFTQSVANIEAGAEVLVEISYVETLQSIDGEYRFDFPMVVAPRYIPGTPSLPSNDRPKDLVLRPGVVLPAPAEIADINGAEGLTDAWLRRHATTIEPTAALLDLPRRQTEQPRVTFTARYDDGAAERGMIFADGVGFVGERWVFVPPRELPPAGQPFSKDTDQVPDASRITPMPVKPDQRAGHDISVQVTIDTGGPGIAGIASASHDIVRQDAPATRGDNKPHQSTVSLKTGRDIPNRDFRLSWKLAGEQIEEAVLTHAGKYGDYDGGFFTLILEPPARIADDAVRPRELIFVLDQSGSMSGFPIECAKRVVNQSIDTMRAQDRFNVISFSGGNESLWDRPRPNTADNRKRAQDYVDQRQGGGGTEMRGAILRALERAPRRDRDADDDDKNADDPLRIVLFVTDGEVGNDQAIIDAIREHAGRTRVFSVGMGHAPNRHLLDEMARTGRGAVDYVLPEENVAAIVQRFADRIATPVLSDIELQFEGGVEVVDMLPSPEHMPDLFDVQPLVIHGRYLTPGAGTLIVRGRTGRGKYERAIDLKFPKVEPKHDTIATLWARDKVGELMREGDARERVREIVKLGESFQILTQHTSFVAVEKQRVTVGGKPTLVRVPIEFPKGMSWKGVFGEEPDDERLAERLQPRAVGYLIAGPHAQPGATQPEEGDDRLFSFFVGIAGSAPSVPERTIPEPPGGADSSRHQFWSYMPMRRPGSSGPNGGDQTLPVAPSRVSSQRLSEFSHGRITGEVGSTERGEAFETFPGSGTIVGVADDSGAEDDDIAFGRSSSATGGGGLNASYRLRKLRDEKFLEELNSVPLDSVPAPGRDRTAGGGAIHVANLPDGTPIVALILHKADRGDVRERLRALLRGDVGQAFQPAAPSRTESSSRADKDVRPTGGVGSAGSAEPDARMAASLVHPRPAEPAGRTDAAREPLGRVLPVKGSDDLWLIAPPAIAGIVAPFAEKLADAKLADATRQATLDELLAALGKQLPPLRRAIELRRRLDDALLERIATQREGRTDRQSVLRVTVLLRDLDPATLATLRRAGFRREGTAEAGSFVVGTIDLAHVETLGLLATVRRVELLR